MLPPPPDGGGVQGSFHPELAAPALGLAGQALEHLRGARLGQVEVCRDCARGGGRIGVQIQEGMAEQVRPGGKPIHGHRGVVGFDHFARGPIHDKERLARGVEDLPVIRLADPQRRLGLLAPGDIHRHRQALPPAGGRRGMQLHHPPEVVLRHQGGLTLLPHLGQEYLFEEGLEDPLLGGGHERAEPPVAQAAAVHAQHPGAGEVRQQDDAIRREGEIAGRGEIV